MSYTEVTVSSYNASPPPDDGTQVASNEITWSGIKTKITDPLKTAIESTQTNITSWYTSDLSVNLYAPQGTLALFQQTAAPTLWTKQTTHNDKALRVVSGTASSGGSTAFSSVFAARTIAQANLPSVNLSAASLTGSVSTTISNGSTVARGGSTTSIQEGGGTTHTNMWESISSATLSLASGTVTFGGSVPLGGSGTALDFAVQYVDLIIASKA